MGRTDDHRSYQLLSQRGLKDLPSEWLLLDDRFVEIRVRQSQRARHARVTVSQDKPVELVIPRRAPKRLIGEILAEKRDWIAYQLDQLKAVEQREPVLGLGRPGFVWLHHEAVPISVCPTLGRSRGWRARLGSDRLIVSGPGEADAYSDETGAAILRWYRNEARHRIEDHVADQAELLGVVPGRVSIRDPRTQWGSCSAKGNLSFSWRLLLAPFDVLDYVVVHELCHLRELNHSKAFWRLVAEARPGYRQQFQWLRDHGSELSNYEPLLASR